MSQAPRVVIVGASLAGLRTAEAVLALLPDARVTLAGAEAHAPYNRPPLSKEALERMITQPGVGPALEKLVLRSRLGADALSLRPGLTASGVDTEKRLVRFTDGSGLAYDWLVAATGLRPRRLPFTTAPDHRFVLRTLDDALALAARLASPQRVIVAGGGFIGCEIAATLTHLGHRVSLVEPLPNPMQQALGPRVAAAMAGFHRARGVDLHLGRSLADLHQTDTGCRVVLDDGTMLQADLMVEAIGSVPNVEWLSDAGLDLSDGVLCDNAMLAVGAEAILGVGDVARFPNPLFGGAPRRVEHWCVPGQTARRAAETVAARVAGTAPAPVFAPLPSFWSDQHGMRLQSFGAPALADETLVIDGDLAGLGTRPCLVEYRRAGRMIGLLGLGAAPSALVAHRQRLDTALLQAAHEHTPQENAGV